MVRLVAPLVLMLAAGAPSVGAQMISFSVGPAIRIFDRETPYEVSGVNGFAMDASVGFELAPSFRLLVGAGMVSRSNPNNIYAPLPPGTPPCGCDASEQLAQGRIGLAFQRGRFLLGAGAVFADGGEDAPTRFGGFAELRVQPFRKLPFLDVGVLGFHLTASTGAHRALVMPAIGLRF
jgi:hypothetical protein